MSTAAPPTQVDVRSGLTRDEFYARYVNKAPVLMKGAIAHLPASSRWSIDYLASLAPDLGVRLKVGPVARGMTTNVPLADYADTIREWEERAASETDPGSPPPYLHDVPLISLIPSLREDLQPFPTEFLPHFFRKQWWVFPQFFVGPSRAVTTFHFDTLLTHNLFFQFTGRKRFTMAAASDRDSCYTYNWRWSRLNAEAPDLERYPLFRDVRLHTCEVDAGDLFYMPPGTLHQVTSLTDSVSFNIDWHDRRSAVRGITAVRHGMPMQNLRYNVLLALGVCAGIPLRALMPALRSYFEYIS